MLWFLGDDHSDWLYVGWIAVICLPGGVEMLLIIAYSNQLREAASLCIVCQCSGLLKYYIEKHI
jgi:predicted Na+-dependent transporter